MTAGGAQEWKAVLAETGGSGRVRTALTRRALLQSSAVIHLLTLAPLLSACARENHRGEPFSDGTYFADGTGFI